MAVDNIASGTMCRQMAFVVTYEIPFRTQVTDASQAGEMIGLLDDGSSNIVFCVFRIVIIVTIVIVLHHSHYHVIIYLQYQYSHYLS